MKKESEELCFWAFGVQTFSMLFKENCFDKFIFTQGKFSKNVVYKFWFIASDAETPKSLRKNKLYSWDFESTEQNPSPDLIDIPERLIHDFKRKINIEKILSVSSLSGYVFDRIFHVVLLNPDISIYMVNSMKKEGELIYTHPLREKDYEIKAEIQDNKYLTIVTDSLKMEFNLMSSNLVKDFGLRKFKAIDQFQIMSDYNKVYLEGLFVKITNFEIKCGCCISSKKCVGFFIGKRTHDPDSKDDYSLAVLNLNYEQEASNRLIGIYNLTGNFIIQNIVYNFDFKMFLLQLKI